MHCIVGQLYFGESAHNAPEGSACNGDHHDSKGSEKGDSPDPGSCFASNPILAESNALLSIAQASSLNFLNVVLAWPQMADTDADKALPFRQAKPAVWIFTPEVCLGPANRSHGPPLLS